MPVWRMKCLIATEPIASRSEKRKRTRGSRKPGKRAHPGLGGKWKIDELLYQGERASTRQGRIRFISPGDPTACRFSSSGFGGRPRACSRPLQIPVAYIARPWEVIGVLIFPPIRLPSLLSGRIRAGEKIRGGIMGNPHTNLYTRPRGNRATTLHRPARYRPPEAARNGRCDTHDGL